MIEILKTILLGIVEGITEWLPISSTGHMILLNEFLTLKVSPAFWELFEVVIQLGAILAVVVLYFRKLNPFALSKTPVEKRATWTLWFKVVVAVAPSAVLGLLLDDWMNETLYNYVTVALALIVYGVIFTVMERIPRFCRSEIGDVSAISYRTALLIGAFQVLALVPGTSRSGATIVGAMILGLSRGAAAEFSFFLAIPTMLGASALKAVKFFLDGGAIGAHEGLILGVGCLVAFLVSVATIRYLTDFVKRHTFLAFGVYRLILGGAVLLYFALQ